MHLLWQTYADDHQRTPAASAAVYLNLTSHHPKWDESLIDKSEWSQFRYRRFMALEDDAWKSVTMGEGMTQIIRFDDDVMLKMDYYIADFIL